MASTDPVIGNFVAPVCVDNAANRASGFVDACARMELRCSWRFPDGRPLDESKLRPFQFLRDKNGSKYDAAQKGSGTKEYDSIAGRDDEGNRWLATYNRLDKYRDRLLFQKDNALCFGLVHGEDDSTLRIRGEVPPGESEPAHPYTDPRKPLIDIIRSDGTIDRDTKVCDYTREICCAWTDTFASTDYGRATGDYTKIPDEDSPRLEVRYGALQIRLDMSQCHPDSSARLSWWLMPSVDPAFPNALVRRRDPSSDSDELHGFVYYKGNGMLEFDGPEVQVARMNGEGYPVNDRNDPTDRCLMKPLDTLNPFDSAPPTVFSELGLEDLLSGPHTFTYWWTPDGYRQFVDGVEGPRMTEARFTQVVASYGVLAREINSGIRAANRDGSPRNRSPVPIEGYRQVDTGIWVTVCNPRAFPDDVAKCLAIDWYQDPIYDAPLAADGSQPNPRANWLSPRARGNIDPATESGPTPGTTGAVASPGSGTTGEPGTGGGVGGGSSDIPNDVTDLGWEDYSTRSGALTWTAVAGATGYLILQDGVEIGRLADGGNNNWQVKETLTEGQNPTWTVYTLNGEVRSAGVTIDREGRTGEPVRPPVTGIVEDSDLKYSVHIEPVTEPGVPASIAVRVLSAPAGKRVAVDWAHDAGSEATIEDPSSLSTTITVTGAGVRVGIHPRVTLVDA